LLRRLLTSRTLLDGRGQQRLQFVLSFSVQLVAALLILILGSGAPHQTPTVIGLTTAGLTVVLKDFIVAFFGWFILKGKNGVRVGDWVESTGSVVKSLRSACFVPRRWKPAAGQKAAAPRDAGSPL
jgi:small-conductance mechanosensitive channel